MVGHGIATKRYITSCTLSNLKNSLKSGGRLTLTIVELSQRLDGPQAFARRLGKPELLEV